MASNDDRSSFDERRTDPYDPDEDDRPTKASEDEAAEQVKVDLLAAIEAERRYRRGELLGEGGMGLVWLTEDRRIGRRVAMKVLQPRLASHPSYTDRFVREALVQGQLEHPSIVPVYDLGLDAEGRAFFTMKRVRGVTLDRIIEETRSDPAGVAGRYSQRRLLSAFSSACLAVDFANRRGVLHRDLKPANIMLGDYGEVYVLDWGIAKLLSDPSVPEAERVTLDGPDRPPGPREGATSPMVGTAGYMSPEQISGTPEAADPTADVYSLGAILFELLTLELLHEGSDADAIKSTLLGVDARPSVRAPQRKVAPELEQICVRATAHDPRERLPSAREIHEAIERYLDGERNAELRRELARRHARAAAAAIGRAHGEGGVPLETRREAMSDIGRALALDPGNEQAVTSLVDLLTEPPREVPDEVRQQLRDSQARELKAIGWIAGAAYLSMLIYLPLLCWSGVRSVPAVSLFYGLAAISAVLSFSAAARKRPGVNIAFAASCTSTLAFAATTTLFGSLLVMPALVAANATGYAIFLRGWRRVTAALFACAAIGIAVGLEAVGLPWSMYSFGVEGMTIRPGAIELNAVPTITFLAIVAIATLLTPTLAVSRIRDNLARAERQLSMQAWQIRQLAPAAAAVPTAGISDASAKRSSPARPDGRRRSGRRVR